MVPGWTCGTCGEPHVGCATCFGEDVPHSWTIARRRDRIRSRRNRDTATLRLDGETHRFLRGHIVIPVVDGPEDEFVWSVWTTLGSESWEQVTKVWDDPAREDLPAMFGWLNSRLPYDQPTLSLRTSVRHRAPGLVPLVEVDPSSGHQLAAEQRDGITWHRVAEINELLLGG